MLGTNLVVVGVSRLPHIYVGRVFQAQLLGAYTVGSEIAHLALTELVGADQSGNVSRLCAPGRRP
jgi:hypothetical protein